MRAHVFQVVEEVCDFGAVTGWGDVIDDTVSGPEDIGGHGVDEVAVVGDGAAEECFGVGGVGASRHVCRYVLDGDVCNVLDRLLGCVSLAGLLVCFECVLW